MYNQLVDEEGNIMATDNKKGGESPYEIEYNEVIQIMSKLCQHIIWNNNPVNKDRKFKIYENDILDLAPRIYALST